MTKSKSPTPSAKDKLDAARWRWWRKWWADRNDMLEKINDVQGLAHTARDLDRGVDRAIRQEKRRG